MRARDFSVVPRVCAVLTWHAAANNGSSRAPACILVCYRLPAWRDMAAACKRATCLNLSGVGSMVSMLSSAKEKNPPADNEMHLDSAGGKSAKEIKGWDFHDHEA